MQSNEFQGDGRIQNLLRAKRSGDGQLLLGQVSNQNVTGYEDPGSTFLESIAEPGKRKLGTDFKKRENVSRNALLTNSYSQNSAQKVTRIPSIVPRSNNHVAASMVEEFLN
jgi:hypothetical protein